MRIASKITAAQDSISFFRSRKGTNSPICSQFQGDKRKSPSAKVREMTMQESPKVQARAPNEQYREIRTRDCNYLNVPASQALMID